MKASSVPGLPVRTSAAKKELAMAKDLIGSLATDWDPAAYRDRHRARVKKLIDRKVEGEEITVAEPPERAEVIDLMKALEESVAAARSGKKKPRKKSA